MNKPIKRVRITRETLDDILAGMTHNPVAEMEIPKILTDIISKGGKVTVSDDLAHKTYKLEIRNGKFVLTE